MTGRKPTIEEAVKIMRLAMTDQQKRENLAFWRERYGEDYVRSISARMESERKR